MSAYDGSSLPGYHGRELGTLAVCLVCHRSGADHLFKPVSRAMRPRAYNPDAKLAGGRGTRKSKAKTRGGRPAAVAP